MTIAEMQDALEKLQGELLITSETANAVEASLSEGVLTIDQVTWAFVGIIRSVEKAAKDIEELANELFGVRKVLEEL